MLLSMTKMDIQSRLRLVSSLVFFLAFHVTAAAAPDKFWVYFIDKAGGMSIDVSPRSQERRQIRGTRAVTAYWDTKPNPEYIEALEGLGLTIHRQSRWLNAVSVSGERTTVESVAGLRFVAKIAPVAAFGKSRFEPDKTIPPAGSFEERSLLDYGLSGNQIRLCQIEKLHDIGLTGESLLVGIMDTGFDLHHPAFAHLISGNRIIATYDFINNDGNVEDTANGQQSHGTAVLSAIGGYAAGSLIGAAYGASYILAKTEIVNLEIVAEEDNWIAAAEWMDSIGVDIISSSLGYIDWYQQGQLDGNTCAITVAAQAAAQLGIIVVNAAGNERTTAWGTLIPPADGPEVIAVGAVFPNGAIAPFSSPGPTADGRIKPDVMAQGISVWCADYRSDDYMSFNGTSMATPLIAGGLALIMQAHPDWNHGKIFDRLKSTASNSISPDNDYGWGIARFYDMHSLSPPSENLFQIWPNPSIENVIFGFAAPPNSEAELAIFSAAGDQVAKFRGTVQTDTVYWRWHIGDNNPKIASGIYLAYLKTAIGRQVKKFAVVRH